MRSNQTSFDTPQFAILSESQKEDIHLATLEVLRRTGVRVFSQEAIDLLAKAGCKIDGNLVKIPGSQVEQAIRTAPPSVTIHDRNGKPAMFLEGTNVYYGTGSDLPNVIDPYTGERRKSGKQDIANAARLCDALPNISFIMSMGLPADVAVATSDVHSFEAMVLNSTKPICYTAHDTQGLSDIIDIAATVAGGIEALREKPFLIIYTEPSSPLQQSKEAVEKLMLIARQNLPDVHPPGIVVGAASPISMAGTVVQANAESLSALVIHQLAREGAPFIFGTGAGPLDMLTMVSNYVTPETFLMISSMAEMGRYYKLPTWGFAGCSDSKLFDEQATIEGAMYVLIAAIAGNNLVHDVGYLESGLTCSFEQIAVMDEVMGLVRRIMSGVKVTDETLAIDLIDQVGPGGHFLSTDLTLKHYKENWYPSLIDRHNYSDWEALGAKTLGERANEKVRSILDSYQPEQLPQSVRDKIAEIVNRADQRARH